MIDIHTHFLPGVDDGPVEFDESIRMLRQAASQGCEVMVATPHQRREWPWPGRAIVDQLLEDLQAALGGGPRLMLGAEVHATSSLLDDLEDLDRGGLLTLADSNHILVEFPSTMSVREITGLVHEVHVLGLRVVVAHPEFVAGLQEQDVLRGLVGMGARLQVTAASVTGSAGRSHQKFVSGLIDADLVEFVASDSHSSSWRSPDLGEAAAAIVRRWGPATADRLTRGNAARLLYSDSDPTAVSSMAVDC